MYNVVAGAKRMYECVFAAVVYNLFVRRIKIRLHSHRLWPFQFSRRTAQTLSMKMKKKFFFFVPFVPFCTAHSSADDEQGINRYCSVLWSCGEQPSMRRGKTAVHLIHIYSFLTIVLLMCVGSVLVLVRLHAVPFLLVFSYLRELMLTLA